ncbi:MAG: VPLPA-CTERM sorting domain-containing protein [Pseudomonadota bacterium]
MRCIKLTAVCAILATLPGTAFAQGLSCDEGFVLDPDTLDCVPDSSEPPPVDEGLLPKLLRFLTPEEGSSFVAGTKVAPTGRTSLTNVQKLPLDLTIVIDDSASMRVPTSLPNEQTPDPRDGLSTMDVVKAGVLDLISALSDQAVVTVITFGDALASATEKRIDRNFDAAADPGSEKTRAQVADFVAAITPDGQATRYDLGFTEALGLYAGGVGSGFSLDAFDRELLFLSDGRPSSLNYFTQLNALNFRGVDPIFVSLPGNSSSGNAVLRQAASRTGGQVYDFSGSAQGLLDAFANPATALFGITSVEITNPDSSSYFVDTDAFGNFTLSPFALSKGDNIFTATALFENGEMFTETLTLKGVGPDVAAVPLPASLWFLGVGIAGLGVMRRRTRNG